MVLFSHIDTLSQSSTHTLSLTFTLFHLSLARYNLLSSSHWAPLSLFPFPFYVLKWCALQYWWLRILRMGKGEEIDHKITWELMRNVREWYWELFKWCKQLKMSLDVNLYFMIRAEFFKMKFISFLYFV